MQFEVRPHGRPFEVGDRVATITDIMYGKHLVKMGTVGTIVRIADGLYGVELGVDIGASDLDGACAKGRGIVWMLPRWIAEGILDTDADLGELFGGDKKSLSELL